MKIRRERDSESKLRRVRNEGKSTNQTVLKTDDVGDLVSSLSFVLNLLGEDARSLLGEGGESLGSADKGKREKGFSSRRREECSGRRETHR